VKPLRIALDRQVHRDTHSLRATIRSNTARREASLKAAAQAMLNNLVRKAEQTAAGVRDSFDEHRKRSISEHLADYEKCLKDKGLTDHYIQLTVHRARAIAEGCEFKHIPDIAPSPVVAFLADLRKSGTSIGTSNHYLRAFKQFLRWMMRERRINDDPIVHISAMNVATDRRRIRRALPPEEFQKLIAATETAKIRKWLSGSSRAMLYQTAAYTGLRASELGSLTPASFDFEATPPILVVAAAYSKRRRRDVVPLHPELASRLKDWLASRKLRPTQLLWPGSWAVRKHVAEMLRKDLDLAEIPYQDTAGRYFDFHALRHQFISMLVQANVHPKKAQELARHSNITLTMDYYTASSGSGRR
jgi:integrase